MNIRGKHDTLPFITLEDVTETVEPYNYVIFNFNLPEEKRIVLFLGIMKRTHKHKFTKKEIEQISEYQKPSQAMDLIRYIQSILY